MYTCTNQHVVFDHVPSAWSEHEHWDLADAGHPWQLTHDGPTHIVEAQQLSSPGGAVTVIKVRLYSIHVTLKSLNESATELAMNCTISPLPTF